MDFKTPPDSATGFMNNTTTKEDFTLNFSSILSFVSMNFFRDKPFNAKLHLTLVNYSASRQHTK